MARSKLKAGEEWLYKWMQGRSPMVNQLPWRVQSRTRIAFSPQISAVGLGMGYWLSPSWNVKVQHGLFGLVSNFCLQRWRMQRPDGEVCLRWVWR
jgi:hypothetical protein